MTSGAWRPRQTNDGYDKFERVSVLVSEFDCVRLSDACALRIADTHHVHWRTAQRGRHVAVAEEARETKIGDLQRYLGRIGQLAAAFVVQQDILRLEVAMHDFVVGQGGHGAGQLDEKQTDGVLAEGTLDGQIVGQIAAVAVLQRQIS